MYCLAVNVIAFHMAFNVQLSTYFTSRHELCASSHVTNHIQWQWAQLGFEPALSTRVVPVSGTNELALSVMADT